MVKGLLKLLGLLLVLLVVGIGVTLFYLDRLAKVAVERGGSYALGVNTRVDAVSIRPLSGQIGLSGFAVDNPIGFDRPAFLVVTDAFLEVDMATLRQDVIRSPKFEMNGIYVDLEKSLNGSNYDAILNNLERFESGKDTASEPTDTAGTKFVIEEVAIRDINAEVALVAVGDIGRRVKVHVPEIVLHSVGSDGAVDMAELTDVIVKAVLQAVVASGDLPGQLAHDLTDSLDDLTGLSGSLGSKATGAVDRAAKELNKGLGKALGGLFGKKDEKN